MNLKTKNGEFLTAYYDDSTLKIIYQSGKRCHFKNVPQEVVYGLYESDDAFRYLEENVKRKFYSTYK